MRITPVRLNLKTAIAGKDKIELFPGVVPALNTCEIALQNAPLPLDQYIEVLVDAGDTGRAFRALVNATAPVSELCIANISDFNLDERTRFAAFAEAREYNIFLPEDELEFRSGADTRDKGFGRSAYPRAQSHKIKIKPDYYFLSPIEETDVILAPFTCACCFDAQYLDYLKSCFDLKNPGALLLIRFDQKQIQPLISNRFLGWLRQAGFEESWFFGYDSIADWESQKSNGFFDLGISRSFLFPLNKIEKDQSQILGYFENVFGYLPNLNFNLYLAFQRTRLPPPEIMLSILQAAIAWEETNFKTRIQESVERNNLISRRPEQSQERLQAFKTRIPELIQGFSNK